MPRDIFYAAMQDLPWNTKEAAKQIVDKAKDQYNPDVAKRFRKDMLDEMEYIDKERPGDETEV